jgi:hypothetical protein
MTLLLVFLITLIVGQAISVGIGLLVERHATPYAGLMAFIACYFAMFWIAWRFAVRMTKPKAQSASSPVPENRQVTAGSKSNAVLLGACAATEDLWTSSSLLLGAA